MAGENRLEYPGSQAMHGGLKGYHSLTMCHVYPCVKPKIKIYGTWQVCLLLQQHEIA